MVEITASLSSVITGKIISVFFWIDIAFKELNKASSCDGLFRLLNYSLKISFHLNIITSGQNCSQSSLKHSK